MKQSRLEAVSRIEVEDSFLDEMFLNWLDFSRSTFISVHSRDICLSIPPSLSFLLLLRNKHRPVFPQLSTLISAFFFPFLFGRFRNLSLHFAEFNGNRSLLDVFG